MSRIGTAVLIAVLSASLTAWTERVPARQAGQAPQRPVFRTAASLVRLDVYPSLDGRGVDGLTAADFEILEDGVPQKVATFEHVAVRPPDPTATRREPRSLRESVEMAAEGRNRLFVLFLDTLHVADEISAGDGFGWARRRGRERGKPLGPRPIDRGLVSFFDKVVGPDDLFAVMTPEMEVDQLAFGRRTGALEELLDTVWGRQSRGVYTDTDDLDPEEEQWLFCYPPEDARNRFPGIADEMIARRREARTFASLRRLVSRLAGLREERKAVLVVSEGWPMFRPDHRLARPLEGEPLPAGPGIYIGPDGKMVSGTDPRRIGVADPQACNAARTQLAMIDNEREFRALPDEANRANVSFYPVYPHGLMAPADANAIAALKRHQDQLYDLASATDGVAVVATNDYDAGLQRIANDLSDYYLVGYYSTNTRNDGRFRRITVRAKRPGVTVRTRSGYRALTEEEATAVATSEARPDPEEVELVDALATLDRLRADRALHVLGAWTWRDPDRVGLGPVPAAAAGSADRSTPRAIISVVVELDASAARRADLGEGATVRASLHDAGGRVLATGEATVSRLVPAGVIRFRDALVGPGRYTARAVIASNGEEAAGQALITVPDAIGLLGGVELSRRGQGAVSPSRPAADPRFRRSERVRAEVVVTAATGPVTARLLDRRGQPLTIPAATGQRDEAGQPVVTAEFGLAPLAPGDYLIEIAAGAGVTRQRLLVPIRIVP